MDLLKSFEISQRAVEIVNVAEKKIYPLFQERAEIRMFNQWKVLEAFQYFRLSATDFHWSTGYGYGDVGREKIESVYARIFKGEDALVRPSIASGTHALALTMQGILKPGDEMVYISGLPYDTMQTVIGLTKDEPGNLMEMGITYKQCDLNNDGSFDKNMILNTLSDKTRLAVIQRSSGYTERAAISIAEMEEIFRLIHEHYPEIIIMVDNCYGEFTETKEPLEIGADIIAGSLIKNPGGGIAPGGGYVVGREDLIDRVANRLTAPGVGRECGLMYDTTRLLFQGLYFAPHVTYEATMGAILISQVFKDMGYQVIPDPNGLRSDIIAVIELKDEDKVIAFCQAIQKASAVDSYVTPIPWDMPGYDHPVIMAAGGLIEGSSIELSADGPIREPYSVFYQGGLTYDQCKLAAYLVISDFMNKNLL